MIGKGKNSGTSAVRESMRVKNRELGRYNYLPVFLSPNICAWNFKQAVWAMMPTDPDGDTSAAPHQIAFFAEVGVVKRATTRATTKVVSVMKESLVPDGSSRG